MKTNLLLTLAFVATSSTLTACSDTTTPPKPDTMSRSISIPTNIITQLVKNDVKMGTGALAKAGQTVTVHYTGWLYDESAADKHGIKFDSSRDRGKPFKFPLGAGRVIKGWDQGFAGMKVGGQRTLIIPANMGYGSRGAGRIPPNATLIFDVELLGVN